MNERKAKLSYIRQTLEDEIASGKSMDVAKQEIRQKLVNIFSALPNDIFAIFYNIVAPASARNKRLLESILLGEEKKITMDTTYQLDITHDLPSMTTLLKDEKILLKRIMKEIAEVSVAFPDHVMQDIERRVKEFLQIRKEGIDLFYRYKESPHRLLNQLLAVYRPLDRDDSENEEVLKEYLRNKNMMITLDVIYGSINFFADPSCAQKYNIDSVGRFRKQFFTDDIHPLIDDEDLMTDDEDLMIDDGDDEMNPSFKKRDAYVIFGELGPSLSSILIHERQHLINNTIGKYNVDDYLAYGQNEIIAYLKQGVKKEDVKAALNNNYQYYHEIIAGQKEWIHMLENRIEGLKSEEMPSMIIQEQERSLQRNKDRMEKYKTENNMSREEYKDSIGKYINIAYSIKNANVPNYCNLLAMTPIRNREKLIDIYGIKQ